MTLPDIGAFFSERVPLLPSFGKALAARPSPSPSEDLRLLLQTALAPTGRGAKANPSGALAIASSPRGGLGDGSGANGLTGPRRDVATLRRAGAVAGRILRAAAAFVVHAHVVFVLSTSLLIIIYSRVDPPVTVLMAYRKFSNGFPVKRPIPIDIGRMGKRRRDILIRVEDWTFYSHRGFELAAIKNAARINKRIGRPMYGGSTLSMQTARTLFLVPFKSYFRKYLEAIVTVELELFLSKDRILELYYSFAEWGRGIFGVQAASYAYYKAPVWNLSDEQYIRLVSLLSSPVRHTPQTLFKNSLLAWRYNFLMDTYLPRPPDPLPAEGGGAAAGTEESGAAVGDGTQAPADPAPTASLAPAPNG